MNAVLMESVKVKNAAGAIINPATLEAVQLLVTQAGFDAKLDVALSTRVAEATFTNRLGEVQASPTANTVLGRLKDIDDAVSGTLTVAGTVTANLGTLNGAALDATLQSILTELNQKLEAGQAVVANIGTTGGLALDATMTGGTAKVIARGGAKGATAAGDLTGENVDANTQALHVILKGTQPTITVAGTVTANLGTLNGAALDATLQSILTELQQKTEPANNQNVLLAAAIPAGTNNIGDVDVLTLPAVTQGTSPWVVGDGGGSLTVDGSVSISGAVDTELPAAAALTDNFANPTAPAVGAFNMGWDGTNWDRIRADGGSLFIQDGGNSITVDAPVGTPAFVRLSDGTNPIATLPVSLASVPSHDVTNAGTFAVQASGSVAHDGVDAGNPVKIGAKAIAHGTNPAAVAAADRTDLYANRHGIPFVIGGHPNVKTAVYNTTGAQTDDPVLPAIATGTKYVVTAYSAKVSAACTAAPAVRLGFGSTTIPSLGASGADGVDGILDDHESVVPGSGFSQGDGSGILAVGGDGEELRITNTAPTGGRLSIRVSYYTIES